MTEDDQTQQDQPSTTTAPVRVPNVSPGAVSGLDHEPLGSNAQAAYDANEDLSNGLNPETGEALGETVETEQDQGAGPASVEVPDGTLDEQIEWVSGKGEDTTPETRAARADALYAQESAKDGFSEDDGDSLSARLHEAVGEEPAPETVTTETQEDAGQGGEDQAQQEGQGDPFHDGSAVTGAATPETPGQ